MSFNDIEWRGNIISVDDRGDNRPGFLLFRSSSVKWNGTKEGLMTTLVAHLDQLPERNAIGCPKTSIQTLSLTGDLSFDNKEKDMVVFPVRDYGLTEEEKLANEQQKISTFLKSIKRYESFVIDDGCETRPRIRKFSVENLFITPDRYEKTAEALVESEIAVFDYKNERINSLSEVMKFVYTREKK